MQVSRIGLLQFDCVRLPDSFPPDIVKDVVRSKTTYSIPSRFRTSTVGMPKTMHRLAKALIAAVAALTIFGAGSAAATVLLATYTGAISVGFDTTGEFGVTNRDLTGLPFIATYRYDTGKGTRSYLPGSADQLYGVFPYPIGNPSLGSTLTIAGVTQPMPSSTAAIFIVQTFDLFHAISSADPLDAANYQAIQLFVARDTATPWLEETYLPERLSGGGEFTIRQYDPVNSRFTRSASGQFQVDTLSIQAVPEPGVWILLMLGFGLAGHMLRRRDASTAVGLSPLAG